MTRLSVERLEEIRRELARDRWGFLEQEHKGLPDATGRLWFGRNDRDFDYSAWVEEDPERMAHLCHSANERADLLAELDAVRADLAHCERSYVAARTAHANAETERDDLQARLLVMTRESDEAGVRVIERVNDIMDARDTYKVRAQAAEAHREELAAALETMRKALAREMVAVASDRTLCRHCRTETSQGDPSKHPHAEWCPIALPTSEAATTARRGWEAVALEEAAKACEAYATEGVPAHRDHHPHGDAAEELAARLRSLAEAKRQGGGT